MAWSPFLLQSDNDTVAASNENDDIFPRILVTILFITVIFIAMQQVNSCTKPWSQPLSRKKLKKSSAAITETEAVLENGLNKYDSSWAIILIDNNDWDLFHYGLCVSDRNKSNSSDNNSSYIVENGCVNDQSGSIRLAFEYARYCFLRGMNVLFIVIGNSENNIVEEIKSKNENCCTDSKHVKDDELRRWLLYHQDESKDANVSRSDDVICKNELEKNASGVMVEIIRYTPQDKMNFHATLDWKLGQITASGGIGLVVDSSSTCTNFGNCDIDGTSTNDATDADCKSSFTSSNISTINHTYETIENMWKWINQSILRHMSFRRSGAIIYISTIFDVMETKRTSLVCMNNGIDYLFIKLSKTRRWWEKRREAWGEEEYQQGKKRKKTMKTCPCVDSFVRSSIQMLGYKATMDFRVSSACSCFQ